MNPARGGVPAVGAEIVLPNQTPPPQHQLVNIVRDPWWGWAKPFQWRGQMHGMGAVVDGMDKTGWFK